MDYKDLPNEGTAKPVALLKKEGTFRADRHGQRPDASPDFPILVNLPEAPAEFDFDEIQFWDTVCEGWGKLGLLSTLDLTLLYEASMHYGVYKQMQSDYKEQPKVYDEKLAAYKPSPFFKGMNDAWALVRAAMKDFGMSPLDRSRLKLPTGAAPGEKPKMPGAGKFG